MSLLTTALLVALVLLSYTPRVAFAAAEEDLEHLAVQVSGGGGSGSGAETAHYPEPLGDSLEPHTEQVKSVQFLPALEDIQPPPSLRRSPQEEVMSTSPGKAEAEQGAAEMRNTRYATRSEGMGAEAHILGLSGGGGVGGTDEASLLPGDGVWTDWQLLGKEGEQIEVIAAKSAQRAIEEEEERVFQLAIQQSLEEYTAKGNGREGGGGGGGRAYGAAADGRF